MFQFTLMVWLLGRVVRDRPGILSEIASILRSRGVNIRNVVGNSQALMLEVENHGLSDVFYEVRGIGDIEPLGLFSFPATPLSFSREFFMKAVSDVLSSVGVDF
jgi:ACT domain.